MQRSVRGLTDLGLCMFSSGFFVKSAAMSGFGVFHNILALLGILWRQASFTMSSRGKLGPWHTHPVVATCKPCVLTGYLRVTRTVIKADTWPSTVFFHDFPFPTVHSATKSTLSPVSVFSRRKVNRVPFLRDMLIHLSVLYQLCLRQVPGPIHSLLQGAQSRTMLLVVFKSPSDMQQQSKY